MVAIDRQRLESATRNSGSRRHDNASILPPTRAERDVGRGAAETQGRASLDGNFLKLSPGEKSDPLALGIEERVAAVLSARQHRCLRLIEQARGEQLVAVRSARGIHQPPAIGRDRDSEIEAGHRFRA